MLRELPNGLSLLVCVAGLTACGTSESAPTTSNPGTRSPANATEVASSDKYAILTVKVEAGHTVTFYEFAPGEVGIMETMLPSQHLVVKGTDMLEAFELLRPGQEAPANLVAAYERFQELSARSEPGARSHATAGGGSESAQEVQVPGEVNDGIGTVRQAHSGGSSAAHFVNDHGAANWPTSSLYAGDPAYFVNMKVNWANGYWCQDWSTRGRGIAVDHYSGNGVTIRETFNGNVWETSLSAGNMTNLQFGSASFANVRWDVLNAEGDSFHVVCRFNNW